jgi:uncharacterized protein (DUF427 family)
MTSANSGPGWKKYPGHVITAEPARVRVQVKLQDQVIADTQDAIALREGKGPSTVAPVVYYIPRKDVKMDRLERTSHTTHCPFKGDAAYYSLKGGAENAVWSYETPFDEMLAIREHLAFYPDKVSITVGGAAR